MIDTPEIIQTDKQLAAVIHLIIPRSEMRTAIGPALAELMGAVQAQGIRPAGPWSTHHLRRDAKEFDFQVCVPIAEPVTAVGRVSCQEMPAGRMARAFQRGPYDGPSGLAAAWSKFDQWIGAGDHVVAGDFFEIYLTGPESSSDPDKWVTELRRPLTDF